ncbi:expressed unknown protein [Seminavis robusta]|uniref:Uncharacterized protein n=1 Tax=Seminavis robusta TaxID=568900 RepID=A0A9N8DWL2_9STRA|nr:expressed unknown protein [Seminavis robusta]|eukprot:Sro431_g141420.1 n/a (1331) ;mRNA; f:19974-24112
MENHEHHEQHQSHLGGESDHENWPLHKISEPHPCNDVLWSDRLMAVVDAGASSNLDGSDAHTDHQESVPWRSKTLGRLSSSHSEDSVALAGEQDELQGNQRFRDLLAAHCQAYDTAGNLEKPLVSLKILKEWRQQKPPGRFLVKESDTRHPLYKDMGDKKARGKISKALKQLIRQQSSSLEEPPPNLAEEKKQSETDCAQQQQHNDNNNNTHKTGPQEEAFVAAKREETKLDRPTPITIHTATALPKTPRFPKPNKNKYERRISEQLHTARAHGRLFGRWKERDKLVHIFRRYLPPKQDDDNTPLTMMADRTVPLVLIAGCSGVGKTSLARILRHPSVHNGSSSNNIPSILLDDDSDQEETQQHTRPFFLEGKFELCQWEDPSAVFVTVMTGFCHQLAERNDKTLIKQYRQAIQQAMPDDLPLLQTLVPALGMILSGNASVTTDSVTSSSENNRSSTTSTSSECDYEEGNGHMAMQRIKQVLANFLTAIASVSPHDHPIIILLEDLHWASEPAMGVLKFILGFVGRSTDGFPMFLGTYRTDEELETHFTRAIEQVKRNVKVTVHEIAIGDLPEDSVHVMLSEALSLQQEETRKVKDLIFPVTKGNPTFITELLRIFQERDMIRFDEVSAKWKCDFEQMANTLETIKSVPDLFQAKIQSLPPSAQETMRIAACLGSTEIADTVIKVIDTVGAVSAHLKLAEMNGLLRYHDGRYFFASDSIKQAVIDLIPEKDRDPYRLKIGQRMFLHLEENQNAEYYSLLMSQMMMSDHLVVAEEDIRSVAMFYLEAGQGAMVHLGAQTAGYCFNSGIRIMEPLRKWGRDNYDLSLALYNKAIEVAYCNGEFSTLDRLIDEVLENARTFEDSLPARSTKIYSLGSRNKQKEAIELALEALKEVGQTFPSNKEPSFVRLWHESRRMKRKLKPLSDEEILALPRMKDPRAIAAMQIMNHVLLYAILETPKLGALIIFRMVDLSIKFGLSAMSSIGFVAYGLLGSRDGATDEGIRYGKLAMKLCSRYKKGVWLNRTHMLYYGTIYARKYPIRGCVQPLKDSYRTGMVKGDIEYSVLGACMVCFQTQEILLLPEVESYLRTLLNQIEFYGQATTLVMVKPLFQYVLCLTGQATGNPKYLKGALIDADIEQAKVGASDRHMLMWYKYLSMQLAYIFEDYDLADSFSMVIAEIYEENDTGGMDAAQTLFFQCMVLLAQVKRRKRNRFLAIRYVRSRLKRLKHWARAAPSNFMGKRCLLEAEVAFTMGDYQTAHASYLSAVLHSREGGFFLDEALSHELLGKLYTQENDLESAVRELEEARKVYDRWGAKAKVEHFDSVHSEILNMSL